MKAKSRQNLTRQTFSGKSTEKTAEITKTILEGLEDPAQRDSVVEKHASKYLDQAEKYEDYLEVADARQEIQDKGFTEVFSDDTDLYSTLQADMIEEALEPRLLAMDAIRSLDFELGRGYDSIQIPNGNQLSASQLNSDGSFSEDTTDYDGTSITINWYGVRTTFSGQLVRKTAVDLLAFRMEQAGRAIAREVDSQILTQIEKAGTKNDATYGDNSNYVYTGSGNTASFDDFVSVVETGLNNDANIDMGLLSPAVWASLHKDADTKTVLAFTATQDGEFSMVQRFGPVRVMASSQVSSDKALFVDSEKTAMFVDASSVETFDGRVSENFQFEIMAVKAWGVQIIQPQSVVVLHQDANEP